MIDRRRMGGFGAAGCTQSSSSVGETASMHVVKEPPREALSHNAKLISELPVQAGGVSFAISSILAIASFNTPRARTLMRRCATAAD